MKYQEYGSIYDVLPGEEIKTVRERLVYPAEKMELAENDEKKLINACKKIKIVPEVTIWRIDGDVKPKDIIRRYREWLKTQEEARTVYFYKNMSHPVKVVYKPDEMRFPIHDMKGLTQDKSLQGLMDCFSATLRKKYDLEKDFRIGMKVMWTNQRNMVAVVTTLSDLSHPGLKEFITSLFPGCTIKNIVLTNREKNVIQEGNRELRQKSINHWMRILDGIEKPTRYPGEDLVDELEEHAASKFYCTLEEKLTEQIYSYCSEKNISVEALLLTCFSRYVMKYAGCAQTMMGLIMSGENMELFPVKGQLDAAENMLENAQQQLDGMLSHSCCTLEDVEEQIGRGLPELLGIRHQFLDLRSPASAAENLQKMIGLDSQLHHLYGLRLEYRLSAEGIEIDYISYDRVFSEVLKQTHEAFVREIRLLLHDNTQEFDKESYIRDDDTHEEKLRKLILAQKALYLKESGLFDYMTVDELMQLANPCRLHTLGSSECLLEEEEIVDSLFIIGEGSLEESRIGMDGLVKSIRIMKKPDCIGLECLMPERKSFNTYQVISRQATVLEINRDYLHTILSRHPQGFGILLGKEHDKSKKMQRLWMLN